MDTWLAGEFITVFGKCEGLTEPRTFDKARAVKLGDAVETAEGRADRDACRMGVFVGDLEPGVINGQFSGGAYQPCASVEVPQPFLAEQRKRIKVDYLAGAMDLKGRCIEEGYFSRIPFSPGIDPSQ